MPSEIEVRSFIGLCPTSEKLSKYVTSLAEQASVSNPVIPEVKSYPDIVYLNYYPLGLSLAFTPSPTYKPSAGLTFSQLKHDDLALTTIDLYNIPKPALSDPRSKGTSSRIAELAFSSFPVSPFVLNIAGEIKNTDGAVLARPSSLEVTAQSTGRDFVQCLGEPDRKGGGAGPSSGSIGIWCEWSKDGIMVEFGGDEAKGPQAWERGKDAVWKVITLFSLENGGQ